MSITTRGDPLWCEDDHALLAVAEFLQVPSSALSPKARAAWNRGFSQSERPRPSRRPGLFDYLAGSASGATDGLPSSKKRKREWGLLMKLYPGGDEETRHQLRVVGSLLESFGIGLRDIVEEMPKREQGLLEQQR